MSRVLSPAVFLDRDGTLMREVEYCRDPAQVEILQGVPMGLVHLREAGFRLVIISNQSGIGRGWITLAQYEAVQRRLLELLGEDLIDATYFCPDHPDHATERRKPEPGMLFEAAEDLGLDLAESYFVGDKAIDVECARRAGVSGLLVRTGYGAGESSEGAVFAAEDFLEAVDFILAYASRPGAL